MLHKNFQEDHTHKLQEISRISRSCRHPGEWADS